LRPPWPPIGEYGKVIRTAERKRGSGHREVTGEISPILHRY